jgi:hypothetical protein
MRSTKYLQSLHSSILVAPRKKGWPSRTWRQPHSRIRKCPAFLTCRLCRIRWLRCRLPIIDHPAAREHAVIEILLGADALADAVPDRCTGNKVRIASHGKAAAAVTCHQRASCFLLIEREARSYVWAWSPVVARTSRQCNCNSHQKSMSHESAPVNGEEHSHFLLRGATGSLRPCGLVPAHIGSGCGAGIK